MDPGIMKFLEDDEDEHVHSGADVDAFTAALNRDIGGASATASASESHADDGILSQETAPAVPSTSGTQWQQFTSQKEEEQQRYQQQNQRQEEQLKQSHQAEGEQQHRTGEQPEQGKPNQQEQTQQNHLQQPEQNQQLELEQQQPQVLQQPQPQSQLPHQVQVQQPQLPHQLQLQQPHAQPQLPQQVQIQQPQPQLPHQVQLQQPLQQPQQQLQQLQPQQSALNQVGSSTRRPNMASHSISFGSLIPMILPHISKEQSQRLQALYSRLRRNEVSKEDFLRATRNVVGDQMLVQAVRQMQLKQQTQSQSTQSAQPNQQHSQSSAQQTVPQPNLHQQQLNQNLNQRNQRAPDYQLHSQTITSQSQADTSHPSLENNVQQSRQMGESHPELTAQQMNQTSALNLHQVKHEVDRTVAAFQPSNQQQQHHHHLQAPQTSYSLYGRGHGNYQSPAYSVGTSAAQPNAGKAIVQDSQTRQAIHPQGGVQAQAGSSQLNTKAMGKYEISKVRSEPKRREDEERIARLQSGGASHLSGQPAISQQQSTWSTTVDKDQAASTAISPSVIVKQEVIDPNNDQQHKGQTQQPITDMQSAVKGASHAVPSHELLLDQGQPLLHGQPQTEVVDHQSIKTSAIASANTSTMNQPVGSAGLHLDHAVQVVQVPVATSGTSSTANLHHSLPMYGVPISGGHSPGISVQGQMRVQLPSTPSSAAGAQIRTPPKKPLIGQKKPFELTGPTAQLSSKKQKVAGGLLDQSIDQLNDVTAVSGVNLREEEEQLLSGPKEESHATEALRRVVQEEEEKLVLQKGPMRNKIAGIMAKCGVKNVSSDVERCLSMSVEERLRTMLSNLIRLSKQRVDLEKASHKIALTSDVRRQILLLNKKAKEDWEKKQAEEAEKLRKLNEAENNGGIDGEKDEARAKAQRAQKEEDDKMRANAANVAARAAVGGDDMLSKWKMMAEQARQKREGVSDGASNTSDYKETNRKATVGGLKSTGVPDHQEADNKGPNAAATGSMRTLGRNLGSSSQMKPLRTISVKDIISLLEREPQMSKSTLLYRLYERGTDCVTEKAPENRNNESIFP